MSNTELIRELRALTQAGMKDCKDALEEANWDLQKAIDLVKVKGLNVVDGRSSKVASEGTLAVSKGDDFISMVEVNCQTDFVAKNPDFIAFANTAAGFVAESVINAEDFVPSQNENLEKKRAELVSTIKENIVIRRWWSEVQMSSKARVFSYIHSNGKIGVLLTLLAPTDEVARSPQFDELGNDLAMQVAAMNPLAVSSDRIESEVLSRQQNIFQTQIQEMNKPQAAHAKIMEGKLRKWYTEVCLLEQESVVHSKMTVGQVLKNFGNSVGGEVGVVGFIRAQVGEGIEVQKENYADEVAKLSGVASQKPTGYAI